MKFKEGGVYKIKRKSQELINLNWNEDFLDDFGGTYLTLIEINYDKNYVKVKFHQTPRDQDSKDMKWPIYYLDEILKFKVIQLKDKLFEM